MLRISIIHEDSKVLWTLEGKLAGEWVEELEQCWTKAIPEQSGKHVEVILRAVSYVDESGKKLLAELAAQGAELKGCGCMTGALIEEIVSGVKTKLAALSGKKSLAVVAMLLTLGASANLRAQDPGPLNLTLSDAVALALRQNPQAQIASLHLAESEQDKNLALASLLPQAGASVSEQVIRGNIETQLGRRIPGFPQHVGPFPVFSTGVNYSSAVFDLTLWRRYAGAKHDVEAGRSDQQSVREQVTLLVVSQYLGSLRDAATVQAAQARVDLAQALYDQAADLQKHGAGTGIDALRANVELQNEKQRLLEAQTSEQTALFGLARLLNVAPQQEIELADTLRFFDAPATDVPAALTAAYAARPELRAIAARELSLSDAKRAARDSRWPSMQFSGGWEQQGLNPSNIIPVYTDQISLNLPLFTGGRIRAEETKADLELQTLQQQRTDLQNQVTLEVKTAAANLASARQQVDVANQGVALAQEEVSQARDRFAAGVADNIEVISAQDALARANDNQIAALYQFNQSRADLARATGQIESLYAAKKSN